MEKTGKKLFLYAIMFFVGGCIYSTVEIVFRGYTHFSMFIAGGMCLVIISLTDTLTPKMNFLFKALICGLIITVVELLFGIFLNVILRLNIWNYYGEPFNFLGQICLPFSLLWVLISIPAILVSRITVSLLG